MSIQQIPTVAPPDENTELWQRVRELIGDVNDIQTYLQALSDYFGFFEVNVNDSPVTVGGVWVPLAVTIQAADGWVVQNTTEITATHSQLPGLLGFTIRVTGTSNNRTYDIGLRANGDAGTIKAVPFDTGTVGLIDFSTTLFASDLLQTGEYIEVILRTDIAQTPTVTGSVAFSSTTGAKLPGTSFPL